jgi:hypothetical protein
MVQIQPKRKFQENIIMFGVLGGMCSDELVSIWLVRGHMLQNGS